MTDKTGHQLGTRLIVGSLAVAAVTGLLWMDAHLEIHLGLGLLMLFGSTLALLEFYRLTECLGHKPMGTDAAYLSALITGHWLWLQDTFAVGRDPILLYLLLMTSLCFLKLLQRPASERKMEDVALTLLGWVYLWIPLSFGMRLRTEPSFVTALGFLDTLGGKVPSGQSGQAALAFALAAAKGSDILAYFVGSRLGRNPLAPTISPKKTWEGLGGAVAGGALFGWGVAHWWPALPAGELPAAVLGGLIGGVGQFSDLCESALKRQAGVKDSGSIPALGGMLDMVDSLLLALPVAYYGLLWIHARPA